MEMGTCELCQTKGPIKPCEFCGAHACSSDRRSGFCSVDENHEINWCMDCEKVLSKAKQAHRLVCRDCSNGDELPAELEKDINRRYKKKDEKPNTTISQSDLREFTWNFLEFMEDYQHAHVIELDLDDFVYVVDPYDMMEDFDYIFPALRNVMQALGIEISIEVIGPFDSISIMVNWSDDYEDILDGMSED